MASNSVSDIAVDSLNNFWFVSDFGGVSYFDGTTFVNYTTSDGIISTYVYAVAIDKQNNVWFGTLNGASKFDGTNFTNYTTSNGLIGNTITSIKVDSDNNIWFATTDGVSMFDGNSWINFTMADGLIDDHTWTIHINSVNDVWFGTWSGASNYQIISNDVLYFQTGNDVFTYPNPCQDILNIESNEQAKYNSFTIINSIGQAIEHLTIESNDKLVLDIGNYENGIYLIELSDGKFKTTRKIIKQ